MRHGSLFSGIGGFDLASEWMGWENVFHCEWNEFGHKVLNYYWPKAISYHDITKTDFSVHRGTIDIITGGFPCQPYSMAGKRKGKDDERHLWPEMLRAIREIQPTWVVGENVLGLVNWDGGLVFHEVQSDLEAQGYEVQPYVLPAASVNAPHRRDRVWFVAYSKSCADSRKSRRISNEAKEENGGWIEPGTSSEQQVQLSTESGSLFGSVKNSNKDGWRSDEWEKEPNIGEQRNSCSRDNEWIPTNNEKVRNASDSKRKGLQGCADTREVSSKEGTLGREGDKFTAESTSIDKESNAADSSSIGFCQHSSREQLFSETFGTQFGMDKENASDSNGIGFDNRCDNWQERHICRDEGFAEKNKSEWNGWQRGTGQISSNASDSSSIRQECREEGECSKRRTQPNDEFVKRCNKLPRTDFKMFPSVPPICTRDDGFSDRLDGITFSKWRNESIKAGGNAVVPQVVHQIFKAIEQYNKLDNQLSI